MNMYVYNMYIYKYYIMYYIFLLSFLPRVFKFYFMKKTIKPFLLQMDQILVPPIFQSVGDDTPPS